MKVLIGVDTGGTFTDFVMVGPAGLRVHKEPSTPANPAEAVLRGLRLLLQGREANIVHGSTVATNALLERRGGKTVLLTTRGFEDVLEIGRQARSAIYDIGVTKEPPLVPVDRRIGVAERVGPHGEVLEALTGAEVEEAVSRAVAAGPDGIAICLLHSYANPEHERSLMRAIASRLDVFVTSSHEVLPEFREFERCSTTVANAYVGPLMCRYLSHLERELPSGCVRVMQSNGGIISLAAAQRNAVQTILSGPAGGAVGGFEIGSRAGFDHVITFDMGGTSTDVSLCAGALGRTPESIVGEVPIRVPVIDIHTVGAGGGSLAYRDPGGSLRVGPQSAGADPGPICYGRGGTGITVTDANLLLGRLSAQHFLGGTQTLLESPVTEAMGELAGEMRLTVEEAAEGVLRVANATMERAIRVISLERGFDPRDFTLVCFGGAGGLHAADLARNLNIPRVLVPQAAGILSALGMLLADSVRDYSQTLLLRMADLTADTLDDAFDRLERRAREEFQLEGIGEEQLTLERSADLRYVGQGYELSVPLTERLEADFHEQHRRRYGYADPSREAEIVTVRVRATARTSKPDLPSVPDGKEDASTAIVGDGSMVFASDRCHAWHYDRALLRAQNRFDGPALVVEYSTTTVVPPDYRCSVDVGGNLLLERTG